MPGDDMSRYFSGGFAWSLLVSFILILFVMSTGAMEAYRTITPEQAQETLEEIERQRMEATATSLFLNNFLVSWPLFVPIVGIFPFLMVLYSTGQIIGTLSLAYGLYPTGVITNLIVLGFMEILAYNILLAENVYTSFLALTKTGASERVATQFFKSAILYMLLLFIAAALEMATIGGV